MLKIGIIGAGRMALAHSDNLSKINGVALSAVYDIVPEKAQAYVEKYPSAKIMNSADELVNSPDAELILITSPTYCHREGIEAALKTGKPIFCEKPLCRTREELKELIPLIRNYKNLFTLGFVRRYSPGVVMMKKMLDEGKLGKLICGTVDSLFGAYAREWGDWFADYGKSGGVMLDMLAHHCDLLNYLVGKPASVFAQSTRLPKSAAHPYDYVSATVTCQNGFICNMESSWLRGGPSGIHMTIYGEKGALKLSDQDGLVFYELGGKENKLSIDDGVMGPLQDTISGGMYATEISCVADCVLNGKEAFVNAEDAILAMELCLGMMESAETNRVITF